MVNDFHLIVVEFLGGSVKPFGISGGLKQGVEKLSRVSGNDAPSALNHLGYA
jgi:hypothetical protein